MRISKTVCFFSICAVSFILYYQGIFPRLQARWTCYYHILSSGDNVMTTIDESTVRCRAKPLGCYVPLDKATATYRQAEVSNATRAEMKQECLQWCFNSGGVYTGLSVYTKACICSTGIGGLISGKKSTERAENRWYLANNCKNAASYEIFRKIENCEKNITKYAAKELIGWTRLKICEKTDEMAGLLLRSSEVTTNQCILNCESRGFMIAMPYLKEGRCLCSDYESLFTKPDLATLGSNQPSSPMYNIPIYQTVHDDPACSIRFGDLVTGGPILLTSDPGSGNTWIRHLIEISTGVYTSSIYGDGSLYNGGFFGERPVNKFGYSVPVKDHLSKMYIHQEYQSSILLIRNPRKAFLADWARRKAGSHIGVPNKEVFKGEVFTKFAMDACQKWKNRITLALTHNWRAGLVVIYYENLCENPAREMRRIAEFLQLNSTDHRQNFENRLICMQLDVKGDFKRPARKLGFNPFTEEVQMAITDSVEKVNRTLERLHLPTLPSSYKSRDI